MPIWTMPNDIKYGFTYNKNKHGLCKPQCVLCGELLAGESIKPSKLNWHLETKHTSYKKCKSHFYCLRIHQIVSLW